MSSNHARVTERYCDVCVLDGSPAGLAAALEHSRQRRSVIVIDAGEPDGDPDGREEVRSHGGEIISGRAVRVARAGTGEFRVELAGGPSVTARRVIAADGLTGQAAGLINDLPGTDELGDFRSDDVPEGDAARRSANERDWDRRYGGDAIWSGNPNGTLVNEVSGLAPGRALDVGAGEGGDALWLAGRGWNVTASDISRCALDRVSAEAGRRGLRVECHHADANAPGAFGKAAFDLVSAQYASIPRTPDDRGVRNLLDAVAPGGTLLIVSHDLEPLRAASGALGHAPAFDPDAYVRVDDFAAALDTAWEMERHEKLPRPPGAASASHHAHDIVLRARRLAQ